MAPFFGAIFLCPFSARASRGALRTPAAELSATKCSSQACGTILPLLARGPTMLPTGGRRKHYQTCGKFDLAHWNIIYQNFHIAAPGGLEGQFQKSAHLEENNDR
jgi:hypothetical protein